MVEGFGVVCFIMFIGNYWGGGWGCVFVDLCLSVNLLTLDTINSRLMLLFLKF